MESDVHQLYTNVNAILNFMAGMDLDLPLKKLNKNNSIDSNSTAIQEELIKTTNTVLNTLNDYILDIDHTSTIYLYLYK